MKKSPILSPPKAPWSIAAVVLLAGGLAVTEAAAQTGACCESNNSCTEGSEAACTTGTWQGDGSACATHCPEPTGTQFTFQGALTAGNGVPLGGAVDLRASLWSAAKDGVQVAGPMDINDVNLDHGLFTVQLDFGAEVFTGEARWLEIGVRHPSGAGGPFDMMSPRQPIRATPCAIQTRGIFVDDNLLVGMGTTSPQFRLDVRSTAPRAIFGWVTSLTGDTHGVFGQSASSQGKGVTGFATADSGDTLGVYGLSQSPTGRGVYGLATSSSGQNFGIYGETNSKSGFAGYFAGRGRFSEDLGVGTSPSARLHVSIPPDDKRPNLRLDTQQSLGGGVLDIVSLEFSGNAIDASSLAAGPLPIRLNPGTGGDVFLGYSGGHVGVNTESPDGKLHVRGSDNVSPSGGGIFIVEHGPSGNQLAFDGNEVQARSGGTANTFHVNAGGGNVSLVPNGGGDVGIGTSDPAAHLHVQGGNDGTDVLIRDGEFARMRMVATDPTNDVTLSIQARGSGGPDRAEIGTVSSHDLVLYSNGTVRIRIGSDGSVCIGGGC